MQLRGGGGRGVQEVKGLARDGARGPSGARSTQPLAGGQVAGTIGCTQVASGAVNRDAMRKQFNFVRL
jgi:hypothetical protein